MGIKINRKELTKTFMMTSNCKKSLVSMAYTKIIQRCEGYDLLGYVGLCLTIISTRLRWLIYSGIWHFICIPSAAIS